MRCTTTNILTLHHSQHLHAGRALEPRARAAQEVVAALRAGCADVTADAHRAHRAMDGARLELAAAHAARQAARRCGRARPAAWAWSSGARMRPVEERRSAWGHHSSKCELRPPCCPVHRNPRHDRNPTRWLLRTGERSRAQPSLSAAARARRVVERGARAAPEGDPWLGVARCVAAGAAVAAAGTAERAFLERAFARVCELEMRRAGAVRAVAATLVHAYRRATCS